MRILTAALLSAAVMVAGSGKSYAADASQAMRVALKASPMPGW